MTVKVTKIVLKSCKLVPDAGNLLIYKVFFS